MKSYMQTNTTFNPLLTSAELAIATPHQLAELERLSETDPVAAFDLRTDIREAAKLAKARAAGHSYTVCPRCGDTRTLNWLDGVCNNASEAAPADICGGIYRLPALAGGEQ